MLFVRTPGWRSCHARSLTEMISDNGVFVVVMVWPPRVVPSSGGDTSCQVLHGTSGTGPSGAARVARRGALVNDGSRHDGSRPRYLASSFTSSARAEKA